MVRFNEKKGKKVKNEKREKKITMRIKEMSQIWLCIYYRESPR